MNGALLTKDLLVAWRMTAFLLGGNLALGLWMVSAGGRESGNLWTFAGALLTTVVVSTAMIPATLVSCERERRHLILLNTLPVTSRRILWNKYLLSATLSLATAVPAAIPWISTGMMDPFVILLLIPLVLGLSATAVLVTVLTRQPLASMGLLVAGYAAFGVSGLAVFGVGLDPLRLAAGTVLPAVAAAAVMLELAAQTMARRELEL